MKSKSEIAAAFWVVLFALREAAEKDELLKGHPNGHLYIHFMDHFDLGQWTLLIAIMQREQLLTEWNHILRITPKGMDLCAKLDAVLKDNQTQPK